MYGCRKGPIEKMKRFGDQKARSRIMDLSALGRCSINDKSYYDLLLSGLIL